MKYSIVWVLICCVGSVFAQPRVPSRMEFADIKLRINENARKEIQEHVDALTRSQTHYNIMAERARSYFPIIERIFKEENLPVDFKYLALQESALIPDAVSSSDAVGYWQFKDFTAIEMGLRVDRHIDERKNIVAASRAAANYLKKNNSYFDNWLHALQAYQMGAGGAMRVLDDMSGVKSMTIDKKTYWYVKKYLAHKIAYEGMTDQEPKIKLSEYIAKPGDHLKDVANKYKIDEGELESYNKWLLKGKVPGDKEYVVIVPSKEYVIDPSTAGIAKHNKRSSPVIKSTESEITYTFAAKKEFPKIERGREGFADVNGLPAVIAQAGEGPADLAKRGGLELSKFLKYNEIGIDHHVKEGDFYYLKKKKAKGKSHYHILQPGEDLWEVSQNYSVRLNKLKTKNRIREQNPKLKAGRVVWLRYVRPARIPIEYREVEKPVTIAKKPEKAEPEIVREPVQDSVMLRVYPLPEEVNNTVPLENTTENDNEKLPATRLDSIARTHVVAPGETYYSISKRYNSKVMDLLDWNDLHIHDKLAIGQKLLVYEYILPRDEQKNKETVSYIYYTVQPGDTLYKIARTYDITVEELMDLNGKSDFNLNFGEKIKVGLKKVSD